MENELYHHGILGMKWGVRRYQNKDGTLTAAGKKRYGDDKSEKETDEQKRERLLKSTNPQELYKNRNLLTTEEINERLKRIDAEKRLSRVAEETKKSGMDRVDQVLEVGRKVNAVYEFTNTPVMKAIKKKLGFGETEEKFNLQKIADNMDKLSDEKLTKALKRANTEKAIKNLAEEAKNTAEKAKEKEVIPIDQEPYAKKGYEIKDGNYSKWQDMHEESVSTEKRAIAGYLSAPIDSVSKETISNGKSATEAYIKKLDEVGRVFKDEESDK